MNLILLGNYSHDGHESMNRYAEMVKALLIESGSRVEILRPQPFFGLLKPSGQGIGKWLGYLDKYLLFPITLRRHIRKQKKALEWSGKEAPMGNFLVHICDQSNAVYTRWLQDVPHLVTCHDVMAIQTARGLIPGLKTGWTGRRLQDWILSGLRRAAYVVCDTPETRLDLLALAPELESRSCTVEIPLNHPYQPMPTAVATSALSTLFPGTAFMPGRDRFVFHVGGNQWYKNREGLIRIFAQLCTSFPDFVRDHSLKLVMAGKSPTESMHQLVHQYGLTGMVLFVTDVSDQQLCAFYSLAEVLAYPSLKEGFGWPLIEAQACACPVVTSDRPPMSRLAGPAGLLADPENSLQFAEKVFQLLSEDPEARTTRKEEALRHSLNYDGRTFVQQMNLAYQMVFGKTY